jgi:LmbE family N-acetylglucosaminyl deacetylase
MSDTAFSYKRIDEGRARPAADLTEMLGRPSGAREPSLLLISPHDDDALVGAGLLILAAAAAGLPTDLAVVTDGAMGYCRLEQRETIRHIRREETFAAYASLGLEASRIHWLGLPDGDLPHWQGRRFVGEDARVPGAYCGASGLQNAFCYLLRRVRPTHVVLPTAADLHPDHRVTHSELMISCFHAGGAIWPELGEPLEAVPAIHEMAVYCNFPSPPQLQLRADLAALERKLAALACFASQEQIGELIEAVRRGGPVEYFRRAEYSLYDPAEYEGLFEGG